MVVYSKKKPLSVKKILGIERFDNEGRLLELEYPEFLLVNFYMPHGGRPRQNQNNIMFTLKERKQVDRLIELGFVDSFRKFHKKAAFILSKVKGSDHCPIGVEI